jgi:hypothetical protein
MEIPKVLKDEIEGYCHINDISNINEFTLNLIKTGFTVEKFGATPSTKIVEKEVEKIVEVEKVVEVEKIVEVPVEKIIEKEVYITNDDEVQKMASEVTRLTSIIDSNEKNMVDTLTKLNDKISLLENQLSETKSLLEIEKNKNKRDIYGE